LVLNQRLLISELYCHYHAYPSVHGFVNTSLVVDEDSQRQIIQIRRNIKGSASAELRFTLTCTNTSCGKSKM